MFDSTLVEGNFNEHEKSQILRKDIFSVYLYHHGKHFMFQSYAYAASAGLQKQKDSVAESSKDTKKLDRNGQKLTDMERNGQKQTKIDISGQKWKDTRLMQ